MRAPVRDAHRGLRDGTTGYSFTSPDRKVSTQRHDAQEVRRGDRDPTGRVHRTGTGTRCPGPMTRCALLAVLVLAGPASAAELDGTVAEGSGTVGMVLTALLVAMALRGAARRGPRAGGR